MLQWRIRAPVALAALVLIALVAGELELDSWGWSLESSWGWE
jgi:hypothetical protein